MPPYVAMHRFVNLADGSNLFQVGIVSLIGDERKVVVILLGYVKRLR